MADPETHLGIVVLRKTGRIAEYLFQLVEFGENGRRFYKVPFLEPDEGYKVEDVVFSLVRAAREFVEAERAKDVERSSKKVRKGGRDDGPKGRPTGLSQLAKKDAQAAGHDFVGKTARKKSKRS